MQVLIDQLISHQAIIGALVIAILDFAIAVNKNLESNGIVHGVYTFFKNVKEKAKA